VARPLPRHLAAPYAGVPRDGTVLDVGCLGFRQVDRFAAIGRHDVRHAGVDYCDPEGGLPQGFEFRRADLSREALPFEDDRFDLVVASHVLEHVTDPIGLARECVRVCRPGGRVYLEVPSERALWLPGMPFSHEDFYSLSYYDDPTHLSRPWTPQALHRLARYFGCAPERTGYVWSLKYRLLFPVYLGIALALRDARRLETCCWQAIGWACYAVVAKPPELRGAPSFRYYVPAR
jgi:SAM-dependent methyltransferase